MTIVAREPLAKSEVEIAMANVATMLVSASRMISGEVVPNFEAIVEQNEMSFAQKRKDVSTVQALLTSENAVEPMLQKAAETIRAMPPLSEAIPSEATIPTVLMPAKPLPEGSLLRDTLRRLHYVQKVVEAVAKWVNHVGEHDCLKESVLYTKTQQELIRTFKRVVIQVQQATVIIGKYRDMGDIRVLREMTLDAHTVLSELREADESVAEKRKSMSLFKRAIEESKAAPKIVRQLAPVAAGLATVVLLSFVVIRLHALAPQVFLSTSEPAGAPSVEQEIQTSIQSSAIETPIKSEITSEPKEIAPPIKAQPQSQPSNETTIVNTAAPRHKESEPSPSKPAMPTISVQPKPEAKKLDLNKPDLNKSEATTVQAKKPVPTRPNVGGLEDKAKSITPVMKTPTNKPSENRAKKSVEQIQASPTVTRETETPSQKKLEREAPKRKTIVIED